MSKKAASHWETMSQERFLSSHTSPVMWAVLSSGGARLLWTSDAEMARSLQVALEPELLPTCDAGCHQAEVVIEQVQSKGIWRGRVTLTEPVGAADPNTSATPPMNTFNFCVGAGGNETLSRAEPLAPAPMGSVAPHPPHPAGPPDPHRQEPSLDGASGSGGVHGYPNMETAAVGGEAHQKPTYPRWSPSPAAGGAGQPAAPSRLPGASGMMSTGPSPTRLPSSRMSRGASSSCHGAPGSARQASGGGRSGVGEDGYDVEVKAVAEPEGGSRHAGGRQDGSSHHHHHHHHHQAPPLTLSQIRMLSATGPRPISAGELLTTPLPNNAVAPHCSWPNHVHKGEASHAGDSYPHPRQATPLSLQRLDSRASSEAHRAPGLGLTCPSRASGSAAALRAAAARQREEMVDLVGQVGASRASMLLAACPPRSFIPFGTNTLPSTPNPTPTGGLLETDNSTANAPAARHCVMSGLDNGAHAGGGGLLELSLCTGTSVDTGALLPAPQAGVSGSLQPPLKHPPLVSTFDSTVHKAWAQEGSTGNTCAQISDLLPDVSCGRNAIDSAAPSDVLGSLRPPPPPTSAAGAGCQAASHPPAARPSAPPSTSNIAHTHAVPGHTILDVVVERVTDPGSGVPVLVVSLQDATTRAALEAVLGQLAEGQLAMTVQMFPLHILAAMAGTAAAPAPNHDRQLLARSHNDVTLLFMDIQGFTSMAKVLEAHQVMGYINDLFSLFDDLVEEHGVHKVETAGDCYIVSAGAVVMGPDGFMRVLETHDPALSAARVMAFAKDMLEAARAVMMPHTGLPSAVRVGLHTGPCTSGLVGSRLPKFALFGDSMNTASRMESTAPVGRIQVSEATHALLPHEQWESTGGVEVKGKGLMMTYLWVPSPEAPDDATPPSTATAMATATATPPTPLAPAAAAAAAAAALAPEHRTEGSSGPQTSRSVFGARGCPSTPLFKVEPCRPSSHPPSSLPAAPASGGRHNAHAPLRLPPKLSTAAVMAAGAGARGGSTAAATLALSSLWALADSAYGEGATVAAWGARGDKVGGLGSKWDRDSHIAYMRFGSQLQYPTSAAEPGSACSVEGVGWGRGLVFPPRHPTLSRQDSPQQGPRSSSQLPPASHCHSQPLSKSMGLRAALDSVQEAPRKPQSVHKGLSRVCTATALAAAMFSQAHSSASGIAVASWSHAGALVRKDLVEEGAKEGAANYVGCMASPTLSRPPPASRPPHDSSGHQVRAAVSAALHHAFSSSVQGREGSQAQMGAHVPFDLLSTAQLAQALEEHMLVV